MRDDNQPVESVRASYADFLWGVPEENDPVYPALGLSTAKGEGEAARKIIFVSEKTPAERAGFQAGDVLLTLDGEPIDDSEELNRAIAAKRWGDVAVFTVSRGGAEKVLTVVFRRR